MTKETRTRIKNKFGGRCAYCGAVLDKFHIDHVEPLFRGRRTNRPIRAGEDKEENMYPSCVRCNLNKQTRSLQGFRNWIKRCTYQLSRDIPKYRLVKDFGVIKEINEEIAFWFEKYQSEDLWND